MATRTHINNLNTEVFTTRKRIKIYPYLFMHDTGNGGSKLEMNHITVLSEHGSYMETAYTGELLH